MQNAFTRRMPCASAPRPCRSKYTCSCDGCVRVSHDSGKQRVCSAVRTWLAFYTRDGSGIAKCTRWIKRDWKNDGSPHGTAYHPLAVQCRRESSTRLFVPDVGLTCKTAKIPTDSLYELSFD